MMPSFGILPLPRSIGGFVFGASQLIMLYLIIQCIRRSGAKASNQVWEGAHGLEWTLPSPPPYHTFTTPPQVTDAVAHS